MPSIHPVVHYQDFYKKISEEDTSYFLRKYPTDLIILRLSKINAFLFQEGNNTFNCQSTIFTKCFSKLSDDKKRRIAEIYASYGSIEVPIFFTSASIIKLISIAFINFRSVPDDEIIHTIEFEDHLLDAILITNQVYYSDIFNSYELNSYQALWHLGLIQQSYIRQKTKLSKIAPIKFFFFHKFISEVLENGQQYINEFTAHFKLTSFLNYITLYFDILRSVFIVYQQEKDIKHILNLSEQQIAMIEPFSFRPEDFINGSFHGKIHKEIIPHPFYFLKNKFPTILDFHFFYYIIDIGISYNFYQKTSLNGSNQYPDFISFKSMLGKKYYEQFILRKVFDKVFSNHNYRVIVNKENSILPDFSIVHNEKNLLLIEVKSSSLNADVMEEIDIKNFKQFLDKNFLQKKTSTGVQNKGIFQLTQQIIQLAETKRLDILFKNPTQKSKCSIYPILITTENTLDNYGVNNYLNDVFQNEIEPFKKYFRHVYPLTVIHLDFFLYNYHNLSNSPSQLKELIKSYWQKITIKNKAFEKGNLPLNFLQANISFEQYINDYVKYEQTESNFIKIVKDLNLA